MPWEEYGFTPDQPSSSNWEQFGFTPDPPQQPERSWWDTGAEMAISTIPSIAGSFLGPVGGAVGSGLGEMGRQMYANPDDPFNWGLIGTETAIGAIPFGKAGKGLWEGVKFGAKTGAAQAAIGSPFRHIAETGELPTWGQAATETGMGTIFGGAMGGGMHFLPQPKPRITPGAGAENIDITPPPVNLKNVTPLPGVPPSDAGAPPPSGGAMTSLPPSFDVSINDPARHAELKAQGYVLTRIDGQTVRFVRQDLMNTPHPEPTPAPIQDMRGTPPESIFLSMKQIQDEFGHPVDARARGDIVTHTDPVTGRTGWVRARPAEPPKIEEPPIESYDNERLLRGETPFGSAKDDPLAGVPPLDIPLSEGEVEAKYKVSVAQAVHEGIVERVVQNGEVGYIEIQGDLPVEGIGGFRHIGDEPHGGSANETPSEDEIRRYLSRMLGRPATDDEVARAIARQAQTGEFTGRVAPFPPPEILAMRHDDLGNVPKPPIEDRLLNPPPPLAPVFNEALAHVDNVTPAEVREYRDMIERGYNVLRRRNDNQVELDAYKRMLDALDAKLQPELPGFLRPGEGEPGYDFNPPPRPFDPNVDEVGPSGPREALQGFDAPRMGQQDLPFGPLGRAPKSEVIPRLNDLNQRNVDFQNQLAADWGPKQQDLPGTVSRTGIGAKPETIVTPAIKGGVNGPEWYNHPDKIGQINDLNQARQVEEYWHSRSMERHNAGDSINADKYANLADLAEERYAYLEPRYKQGQSKTPDLYAGQPKPKSDIEARQRDIENRYQAHGVARDKYRLPDGTIVPVDATATKGAQTTDFTMRDGSVVKMEYVGPMGPNDKIDMKTGRVTEAPKAVVRPMTEFGSKQWGIYVNNELIEGGFFTQKAAKDSAWNYGELDTSTPYAELPEGFEDDFSRSFDAWDREQQRPYNRGQLDLPLGKYETGVPRKYEPFPYSKPRNELGQFITAAEAAKQQQDIPGLVSRSGVKAKPETIVTPGIRGGSGEGEAPIPPNRIVEINAPKPTDPPIQPPGNVPPDQVPPGSRPPPPDEPPASVLVDKKKPPPTKSGWEQAYDAVRNLTTGLDISAPMRQGLPLIATKSWWTSWNSMLKAWGSQAAYDANMKSINDHYLYAAYILPDGKKLKGFGQRMGLRLIDELDHVEEVTASKWLEKHFPGMKASNRAYNAYLNKLRSDTFTNLIEEAKRLHKATGEVNNPFTDETLAREIAEFVNTATGAASLKMDVPAWMSKTRAVSFEQSAKQLGYLLFSPRQTFSRARMLNPLTYANANPYVRQQYMRATFSSVAAWSTIAGAASISGYADEVSLDPTSADFGKIRIGKTRLDAGGGFQQYMVAAARLLSGQRTTAASSGGRGNTQVLGEGYQARTGLDVAQMFISNKLHPLTKFAYDFLAASEYQPFQVGDKIAQIAIPLYMQDAYEIIVQDRPEILPLLFPAAIGMGTQTYEAGEATSRIVPPAYDYKYTGGERPWSGLYRR